MAVVTKWILQEQVADLLKGGDPSAGTTVEPEVIVKMLEQLINASLKVDFFSTHMASGETIPDGLVLATYERIPVVKYKKDFSRAQLPAIPISLPRGMGVFFVGPHVSDQELESNTLAAEVVSASAIDLTWPAIENATSYYLERATDAAFSENLTPLYTGEALEFSDTGLTASTNYWYRVLGRADEYNDSIFANIAATTTA